MNETSRQTSNGVKKQVVVIHGGDEFPTYNEYLSYLKNYKLDFESFKNKKNDWKRNLTKDLGDEYEVIAPRMPNGSNAKYTEWKIWFEKFIPHLQNKVILVGHSLGGIFLVKYLSEENYPKKIVGTFLVGAPFNEGEDDKRTIVEFVLPNSLEKFKSQGGRITFYHSKDDPIVPFGEVEKYKEKLPEVSFVEFKDRLHFFDEHFPELVEDIKSL